MDILYNNEQFHIANTYRNSSKDILVFLHGLGCTRESFADAWNVENLQNYSLLSIDFLGHGDSSKPKNFSYTMEDQAEIISLLLRKIKQESIHLVAHSMGGAIGLLLAKKLGSRLQTFINVEGNLISEDCGMVSRKTISVSFEEFRDTIFNQFQGKMANSEETGSQLWAKQSEKTDPYAFWKIAYSLVAWSDSGILLEIFKTLSVKKTYLYGEKSTADLSTLLNQLPPIPSIAIPQSGHFVMNDNPRDFYEILSKVLLSSAF